MSFGTKNLGAFPKYLPSWMFRSRPRWLSKAENVWPFILAKHGTAEFHLTTLVSLTTPLFSEIFSFWNTRAKADFHFEKIQFNNPPPVFANFQFLVGGLLNGTPL